VKNVFCQKLLTRQKEELAKFCFDISKLALGSWIFGLFTERFEIKQLLLAVWGLIIALLFFTLGLKLFREVK